MYGYFCIRFIDFLLRGESLLEYRNLLWKNMTKQYLNIFSRI